METGSPGQRLLAGESGSTAGCDLFILFLFVFSSFLLSGFNFKLKKAALIRNLLGQNVITPEHGVAKSSSIAGDAEAAAYTISLSSHISFYLIYLAPYIPFSLPALTIPALYPSSTYSSTHIQLYLPSHHYKYPIHPSLPIYLSSERPFPYLPSYIYTYISTDTSPRLSIRHQQSVHTSSPLPNPYPSPLVSFYLPAHPSQPLARRGWGLPLCSIYCLKTPDILPWSTRSVPYRAMGPLLPCPGSSGGDTHRLEKGKST